MYSRGTRIMVIGGGCYLNRWILPGETGTVTACQRYPKLYTVRLDKDEEEHKLAPAEIERAWGQAKGQV